MIESNEPFKDLIESLQKEEKKFKQNLRQIFRLKHEKYSNVCESEKTEHN